MTDMSSKDIEKWGMARRIALIATIVAWVIFWVSFFTYKVWSPAWGPAGSPARVAWEYAYCWGCTLPWAVYWMLEFARHPQWLGPPGRYTGEEKVPVWSPYTVTSIAIFGAIFCVAAVGEFIRVDLQALSIAAASAYFGSIAVFFGCIIGQAIARTWFVPWVGGGSVGLVDLLAWAVMDASIWAYASVIFFRFYHGKPEWPRWKRLLVVMLLAEPVHQLFWFLRYWVVAPYEAALGNVILDWTTYWNISWILVLIGYIIGAAAYEGRARAFRRT